MRSSVTASVVVVARGEPVDRLTRAIAAVRKGDEPDVEVVVAIPRDDSGVVEPLQRAVGPLRIVENQGGERSAGLNLAIQAATGEIVCRIDARSIVPPTYVRRCVDRLRSDPSIGVVGGFQRPIPCGNGPLEKGIARALANPLALGAPRYRRRSGGGPVETVYLGSWRRHELLDLGGFDEHLVANEDFELCQRYIAAGFTVWLEPGLEVRYEARETLRAVWAQYGAFGRAKASLWRRHAQQPNARQVAAMAAGLAGAAFVITSAARPRRLIVAAPAVGAALAILDSIGGDGPADLATRGVSLTTYPVIVSAWLSGIVEGLVGGGQ
jgi:GT2 family glycosyltransferase